MHFWLVWYFVACVTSYFVGCMLLVKIDEKKRGECK